MNENFELIRNEGRLLYEYIRGSHLYGLNNEDSDIDTSAVYIATHDSLLGIGVDYKAQTSDSRHDNTWFEIGELMRLLLKSNPTVLESLFVPEDKMIMKPSPILADLFANRNEFISKQCFMPFIGYAIQQIKKARGLNKKIVNPVYERLTPFDFAYTFYKQGSTKISDWLENRGLDKDCCGLVHVPNMHDTNGVYYDWGAHFEKYGIKTLEDFQKRELDYDFAVSFYKLHDVEECEEFLEANWFEKNKEVKHYRGMCLENSTDMRGSSVSKGERPLCHMVYNESGFQDHCKKYKEYKEWEKNRNPKRYESNLDKNYDAKNIMHCTRLMHMGYEIATGQGIILDRNVAGDRDFLMKIRNHGFEYDELMEIVEADKERLDKAIAESTIKEKIDVNFVNDLLINIRKKAYGMF
jgi:predicted nucleotidyltransferase